MERRLIFTPAKINRNPIRNRGWSTELATTKVAPMHPVYSKPSTC
jgi:hypothetical protein